MAARTFTATSLAKLLDLSAVHVGRMAKAGVLTRRKDGRYPEKAVTEYCKHVHDQRGRTNHTEAIDAEKLRRLQRENDEAEGLLAPLDLLVEALERSAAQVVPVLENIPLAVKRAWPEITGDQIQIIQAAIAEARNIIADMELKW